MTPPCVYAIATMDTKGSELAFVADCLRAAGIAVKTLDVGTAGPPTTKPDISRELIFGGKLTETHRGLAVTAMGQALLSYLRREHEQGLIAGVLGLGGSGGTALIAVALRGLPIGLPKLIVSTVASGQTSPYLDCSDITLMPSVVDIAGLNAVSERILANAAHAMAGMVQHKPTERARRPTLGMTMFGVTTPCVTAVRQALETQGYECLVFHATGTGGRAMEQLVDSGLIQGVLDITTTEVADEIVGGVFPAGPQRFDTLLARRVPLVLSLGALDMVNFGTLESVPAHFRGRHLVQHNAQVTLMRTSVDENRQIARWIAAKLNRSTSPLRLLIPELGLSALDAPGQPFYDPAADRALFDELAEHLTTNDQRQLIRLPLHINDTRFAAALVSHFEQLAEPHWRNTPPAPLT